jgi:hypothetical protein
MELEYETATVPLMFYTNPFVYALRTYHCPTHDPIQTGELGLREESQGPFH